MPSELPPAPELSEEKAEAVVSIMMRRQMGLSLRIASLFLVLLFGLPLLNTYAPDLANSRVLGFTLTWLILGVLVYPAAVLLSYYFVKSSDRIEVEVHQEIVAADRTISDSEGGRL